MATCFPLQARRTNLLAGESLEDGGGFRGGHFRNQQRRRFLHSGRGGAPFQAQAEIGREIISVALATPAPAAPQADGPEARLNRALVIVSDSGQRSAADRTAQGRVIGFSLDRSFQKLSLQFSSFDHQRLFQVAHVFLAVGHRDRQRPIHSLRPDFSLGQTTGGGFGGVGIDKSWR